MPPITGVAAAIRRPADDVRHPRPDLLLTSWAAVGLLRGATRDAPDEPLPVRPRLDGMTTPPSPLGVEGLGVVHPAAMAARAHPPSLAIGICKRSPDLDRCIGHISTRSPLASRADRALAGDFDGDRDSPARDAIRQR